MSEPVNETQLVARIVKTIKAKYPTVYIIKIHGGPMQQPGIPDLLMSVEGMFIGMEVKHPKPGESLEHARSRATPTQRVHIQKIVNSGAMAGVVISVAEALDMIERARQKRAATLECPSCGAATKFGGLCDYCAQTQLI